MALLSSRSWLAHHGQLACTCTNHHNNVNRWFTIRAASIVIGSGDTDSCIHSSHTCQQKRWWLASTPQARTHSFMQSSGSAIACLIHSLPTHLIHHRIRRCGEVQFLQNLFTSCQRGAVWSMDQLCCHWHSHEQCTIHCEQILPKQNVA